VARSVGRASGSWHDLDYEGKTRRTCGISLGTHFVWIPWYRHKILKGIIAERLEALIGEICATRDWEIEALAVEADHVHLFIGCPPRDPPAKVMNVSKSLTARQPNQSLPIWVGRTEAKDVGG
jgi:putative transposase